MSDARQRVELPRSPRKETEWEIDIDSVSAQGWGIGRLAAWVGPQRERKDFEFYVRKAVPGDTVEVAVERRRGERIEAHIVSMVEPSPMRIEPRCRHFGRRDRPGEGCGGCTYQSLSYRHQLAIKEKTVKRLVGRAGLDPGRVEPVIGCEEPWFYRNTMEFTFGDTAEREFALGMHPTGYCHELVNLEECYLQSEFVSQFVPAAREWAKSRDIEPYINSQNEGFARTITVREGKRTDDRLVNLMTTHDERARLDGGQVEAPVVAEAFGAFVRGFEETFRSEASPEREAPAVTSICWTQKKAIRGQPTEYHTECLWGALTWRERMELPGDEQLEFEIHPRAFFQTNPRQAEKLYAEVLEAGGLLEAEGATSTVLDLYCGTGTIGLCMAPYARQVVGVERQGDAVENARKNAADNGIANTRFFEGDVGEVLQMPEFRELAGDPDLLVVDPPRKGLQPEARRQVAEVGAPRIVYVSCQPARMVEDLEELGEAGYGLRSIQPVDMFPQTYHIENVVELVR